MTKYQDIFAVRHALAELEAIDALLIAADNLEWDTTQITFDEVVFMPSLDANAEVIEVPVYVGEAFDVVMQALRDRASHLVAVVANLQKAMVA